MWAKLNINSDICKFSNKILTIIILTGEKRRPSQKLYPTWAVPKVIPNVGCAKSYNQREVVPKAIEN